MDFLQRGIVRLFRPDGSPKGKTLGTGFIAHCDGLLVTCAHVLEKEDGVADGSRSVSFAFYANGAEGSARVLPQYWRPSNREDIAVLQVEGGTRIEDLADAESESAAKEEAGKMPVALPLGYSAHLEGASAAKPRRLRTFGFPRAKTEEGLPGVIEIVGTTKENGFEVFANRSAEVSHGFSGSPVWDDELGAVVGVNVSIIKPGSDLAGRQSETAFFTSIETVRNACDRLALPEGQPYRNLDAFEEEHAKFYFGREEESARLVELLEQHDLVAVIGASGSGKSSLIRAGLLKGLTVANSHLLERPRVRFLAGANPLLAMVMAIQQQVDGATSKIVECFGLTNLADPKETVKQIASKSTDELAAGLKAFGKCHPLILVCDQFERLYTDRALEDARQRFISTLVGAICRDVKVVIASSADCYFSRAIYENGLACAIGDAEFIVPSMARGKLHVIIEKPASLLFRRVNPKVADDLVREVYDRPGDLPLMQFALTELWTEDNTKGILTEASYYQMGKTNARGEVTIPGVRGIAVRRAEAYYLACGDENDRIRFRRLFQLLIDAQSVIAKTGHILGRRVLASELDTQTLQLAENLAHTFLLTRREDPLTSQRTFEVAHEALFRSWPLLIDWTQQEQKRSIWYQTVLFPIFREWLSRQHSTFFIQNKAVILEARKWIATEGVNANGLIHTFVRQSDKRYRRARRTKYMFVTLAIILLSLFSISLEQSRRAVRRNDQVAALESDIHRAGGEVVPIDDGFKVTFANARVSLLPESVFQLDKVDTNSRVRELWIQYTSSETESPPPTPRITVDDRIQVLDGLRILHMGGCDEMKHLPSLGTLKSLETLQVSPANGLLTVSPFDGLVSLRTLDLSHCMHIRVLPKLSGLPVLEHLDLRGCTSLEAIPSLDQISTLKTLDLSFCDSLQSLPPFDHLHSLKCLNIRYCRGIKTTPSFDPLDSLEILDMSGCRGLSVLPSVSSLVRLQELRVEGNSMITSLPELGGLASLTKLDASRCDKLQSLPSIASLYKLRSLDVSYCKELKHLPSPAELKNLDYLDLSEAITEADYAIVKSQLPSTVHLKVDYFRK